MHVAAMGARIFQHGEAPHANFPVLTPCGRRLQKHLRKRTSLMDPVAAGSSRRSQGPARSTSGPAAGASTRTCSWATTRRARCRRSTSRTRTRRRITSSCGASPWSSRTSGAWCAGRRTDAGSITSSGSAAAQRRPPRQASCRASTEIGHGTTYRGSRWTMRDLLERGGAASGHSRARAVEPRNWPWGALASSAAALASLKEGGLTTARKRDASPGGRAKAAGAEVKKRNKADLRAPHDMSLGRWGGPPRGGAATARQVEATP